MEKTLAREIYKRMEIGRKYTTRELLNLIGDDIFFAFQPEFRGWEVYHNWDTVEQYNEYKAEIEMMRKRGITRELWQIVNAGYAATEVKDETYHIVRGLRYHVKNRDWSKVPTQTYTTRRWWRVK